MSDAIAIDEVPKSVNKEITCIPTTLGILEEFKSRCEEKVIKTNENTSPLSIKKKVKPFFDKKIMQRQASTGMAYESYYNAGKSCYKKTYADVLKREHDRDDKLKIHVEKSFKRKKA